MDKIFKQYPELDEAFKTSDGQYFFQIGDAKNHTKTLEDKKISTLKNDKSNDEESENFDFKKASKPKLIGYAKVIGLELDDKLTNAQMIESIMEELEKRKPTNQNEE